MDNLARRVNELETENSNLRETINLLTAQITQAPIIRGIDSSQHQGWTCNKCWRHFYNLEDKCPNPECDNLNDPTIFQYGEIENE